MARRSTALPLPAWKGDLPVFERTLANGFKALVLPRPHAPIVVCDLYYPVGSVDDPAGRSGLAHFLEHMLFKGTGRFPKGQIDRLAFLAAGQANAETGEDLTHYWFAFPSDRWDLALEVEADRMTGALFDPAEVEAERQVIVEERAREVDSPQGRLDQHHLAVSYLAHPYRNPVLGWPDDLRQTSEDDLRAFYQRHYRPDGSVLVMVGDVEPQRVLDRVESVFGGLAPGSGPASVPPPPEPPQNGRRSFVLREPETVARGLFGWHSVGRGHADEPALDVLADLLACGRRSRLWDQLVERDRLAVWADASQEGARLGGQFLVQVEAAPGVEPMAMEEAIASILETLAREGPTPEELLKSRYRLEAAWRWEQEDMAGLASGLGYYALWHHWKDWQAHHRASLEVTAEDVRRVASRYLVENALTVGWSLPRTEAAPPAVLLPFQVRERVPLAPPVLSQDPALAEPVAPGSGPRERELWGGLLPGTAPRLVDFKPRRSQMENGLRVLSERRAGCGTVCLDLYCDSGVLREQKPGVANLAARLREEGTGRYSAEELAGMVEDVGGQLEVHPTGLSLRVRAEDLPMAVEVLADLTLRPAFPPDAFAWTKKRIASEIQADRDDPSYQAGLTFSQLIYGTHPYGRDPRGSQRELSALRPDDVLAHQARFVVPDHAYLAVVGDFEPNRLRSLLRTHLGPWKPANRDLGRLPRPDRETRPRVRRVASEGEQVHVLLGHLGITRNHPDFHALTVLDHILGTGPGFSDRLSRVLRDEMGLAYSVSGSIADSADLVPGALRLYVGTSPGDVDRAVAAALDQLRALHRGEFSDAEVEEARSYLAGSWVFDFQTVSQRAERLLELERWGLPLDEPVHYPRTISQISPARVRRAAARHLDPSTLVRVEYGPARKRRKR